jgi:hypothetical protein
MEEQSLLEMYAAAIMRVTERDLMKGRSRSSSRSMESHTWTVQDVIYYKAQVDLLGDEFKGCVRLNVNASSEHIANVIYRNRYDFKIPEELWEYMVERVDYWRERVSDEDEMFERPNVTDLEARYAHAREREEYYRHRSRRQSLVKRE